jgi:hypothetical protein
LVLVCLSIPSVARTVLDNGQDIIQLSKHILSAANTTAANTTHNSTTTNTTVNTTTHTNGTITNGTNATTGGNKTTNGTTNGTNTNGTHTNGTNNTNGTHTNGTNGTTGGNTTNTTNGTTHGNTTNQTTAVTGPARFNGTCFSCVKNNYSYCPSDNTCRLNSTGCNRTAFDNATGCPVKEECKIHGLDNILRLITNDGKTNISLPVGYT